MDSLEQTPNSREKQGSAQTDGRLIAAAILSVRLWDYPGPQQKLRDLDCAADDTLAELIRTVIAEGQGRLSEVHGSTLTARFGNSFNALSAAKTLQVKLLTFHRNPSANAGQVVAGVMIRSYGEQAVSSGSPTPAVTVLAEANSAQILVSEKIYEAARNIPGFQFGSNAFRATAPGSEAFYELLWTDESTYSHVRKAGQPGATNAATQNRYALQSELGRGAMGIVYKAYDNIIGRTVALKTISIQRNFGDGVELVDRLKMEAKAAGGLDHPNIITIYDIGQQDGFVYLSMQFVEGETLGALLDAGKLPAFPTLLAYAEQMCSAVGFAHQHGVIHRDLKPANFMVTAEGTVKVLDFGIAKFGDTNMTMTGVVVGTPTYMAPEQATGKKLDQRSDIFSLGTVFYELFTRDKPFKGEMPAVLYKLIHEDPVPPSVINPALPNGIDGIIRKALAKNPAERYQNCEEMRDAFREQAALLKPTAEVHAPAEKIAEAAPSQPRPLSSTRIKAVAARRRPANSFGWLTVTALLMLLATIGWALRVKSRTGAFPTVAGRTITITRVAPQPASPNAAAPGADSQPGTIAAEDSSSNSKSEDGKVAPEHSTAPTDASSNSTVSGETAAPAAQITGNSHASSTQVATPETNNAPPAAVQQTASVTDTPKAQAVATTPADSDGIVKSEAAGEEDAQSEPAKPADTNAVRKRWGKAAEPQEVEGFTRKDIPDLLRKADAAAGAGDYPLARYEYTIVLRLDHMNGAARNGLARVRAAREERLGR